MIYVLVLILVNIIHSIPVSIVDSSANKIAPKIITTDLKSITSKPSFKYIIKIPEWIQIKKYKQVDILDEFSSTEDIEPKKHSTLAKNRQLNNIQKANKKTRNQYRIQKSRKSRSI
jgi:hypothetical protein